MTQPFMQCNDLKITKTKQQLSHRQNVFIIILVITRMHVVITRSTNTSSPLPSAARPLSRNSETSKPTN
jgi:hypothetical protein